MFLFPEEGAAEGHGTVIQLYQFQLGAGQGDVAGENPHVFEVGFYDGFLDLCPVDQDVIAGEGDFTLIDAEAAGGVALWPMLPNSAARFTAVVVLPTPPFWLAMEMILPMVFSLLETGCWNASSIAQSDVIMQRGRGSFGVEYG